MKFGTKVTLGLLTIAGLAAVYYGDNYFNQKKEETEQETTHAISFKKEDILNFTLQNKNGTVAFSRENNSSPWKIVQPENLLPEQSTVDATLDLIQQASVQQELASGKTSLAPYGLEQPRIKVTLELVNKKNKALSIGNTLDIGEKNQASSPPAYSSAYALNPEKKGLLVVNYSQLASLEKKSTIDFISKQIGNFDEKNVASIEIKSKSENIFLKKEKNAWIPRSSRGMTTAPSTSSTSMPSPGLTGGAMQSSKVEQFLEQYKNLFAESLVENPRQNKSILEDPAAVITLKDAANKIVQMFYLGIDKNGVYLNVQNRFVGKVGLAMWSDLVPTEKSLKGQ